MENWDFTGSEWWDHATETLKFRVENSESGQREVCGITQTAIASCLGSEDSQEGAELGFDNNRKHILIRAIRLIDEGVCNDEGEYILTTDNY
ncbi:DUF1488 family protein [Hahella sp. KA22]|uniref:DUF1488 family protein n=1 Tax=Hahella sp. KA22 TaxID=1628392 RepID=UPI000FDF1DC3|nr:DUF1488 family protein [Hahella sp. KA22]AZZ94260.1 DUF1488 family protein [Hahella sp. KA22]QAY57634.1 DUF1488 family protein [Hahella sp. KA22]